MDFYGGTAHAKRKCLSPLNSHVYDFRDIGGGYSDPLLLLYFKISCWKTSTQWIPTKGSAVYATVTHDEGPAFNDDVGWATEHRRQVIWGKDRAYGTGPTET